MPNLYQWSVVWNELQSHFQTEHKQWVVFSTAWQQFHHTMIQFSPFLHEAQLQFVGILYWVYSASVNSFLKETPKYCSPRDWGLESSAAKEWVVYKLEFLFPVVQLFLVLYTQLRCFA